MNEIRIKQKTVSFILGKSDFVCVCECVKNECQLRKNPRIVESQNSMPINEACVSLWHGII